jgi:hypothetical protein
VNEDQAALHLQSKYKDILGEFQDALIRLGIDYVSIRSVDFVLKLTTMDCPPGTTPKEVCKKLPGGGVRCHIDCVREGAAHKRAINFDPRWTSTSETS